MNETEFAEALARWMHRDQVDKSGRPYVEHLERVVAMVEGDDDAQAAAWLHDILEDTRLTSRALGRLGFSEEIIDAVKLLTHYKSDRTYMQHIEGILNPNRLGSEIAIEVKIADLRDNLSPERRHTNDESLRRRYEQALEILEDKGQ